MAGALFGVLALLFALSASVSGPASRASSTLFRFPSPLGVSAAAREAGVVNAEDEAARAGDAASDKSTKSYSLKQQQQTRENKLKVLESGAMSLSGLETYKEFLASHPFVLVMYYAPWCYWSKATLPEFHAAAKILAHHEPPVILALVDSVEEEDIANFEDIREFPTLKFFIDGRGQPYQGRRHRTHLVHWVETRLDRDKSLTSTQHLDEMMSNREHGHLVIVGAFNSSGFDANAYVSVARRFGEDVFFGHVQDAQLIDHLRQHIRRLQKGKIPADVERRLANPPFIAVFSKHAHEPDVHLYTGNPSDVAALTSFVGRFRFPLISIFDADRLPENFFTDPRPKAVLIVDTKANPNALAAVEAETSTDPVVRAFLQGARKHRQSLLATVCGVNSPFEKHMLELLGVDEDALPALRIMSVNADSEGPHHPALKFRPEEKSSGRSGQARVPIRTLSPSVVSTFFDDFVGRKLEPYFRSEAVSDEEEPRGTVKTVVGSTFQQLVKDADGDVFIEFYAPWCGYCRKLEPAYKELAARLRDVPGVTIAKIDATRNEVPGMKVPGYPTLFLFPHGKKHDPPLVYSGERTVEDMLEWLQTRVAKARFDTNRLLALDLRARGGEAVGSVLEEL
ncbi:putative thioredoxin [Neospora caninum Liverpool]|uniref:protein disulfide-isomerase n=1 Tax=Neospora caninum (strain Liverpool) TaxID=572307 RepID=F0VMD9_NEOCL|nr:putative thioredoxin [Neospora caninum Liverpool]CBZ54417.1 putative thioredoxin [Neospora caninum Liverpool]CEL69126.1 TPA: thioredoxin, putative [Neospora caninum Liverpool]|eukprot:XP_003884447.1 putative thioredoxin [Neospora caninum Liverpool]